jgi:A/G-specific adenine glycosylase
MKKIPAHTIHSFRKKIFRFYALHKRDLPFRKTTDPYRITVSEIMLQQTQVDRVVPKYLAWIKRWPTWQKLAGATNRDLLTMWSGLGYNRRALMLHRLAQTIVTEYRSKLPEDPEMLKTLPGIGPYTSNAILIFAYNKPLVTIDTNIRRVILHELNLPTSTSVEELLDIAFQLLPKKRSRDWHNALMDYSRLVLPNRIERIPALSKQSKFEGSLRQIRGEIIRQLTKKPFVTLEYVSRLLNRSMADVVKAVEGLEKEKLVTLKRSRIQLT